jgi:hypothetical protein
VESLDYAFRLFLEIVFDSTKNRFGRVVAWILTVSIFCMFVFGIIKLAQIVI